MSRPGENLEEYNDKKCGSDSEADECESLKKPEEKNSRMDEEGKSSNVAESVVPREVCVQFQRWGSCASGERCGFSHDTNSGSIYGGPSQSIGVRQGNPAKMVASCNHSGSDTVCPFENACQFHDVDSKAEYRESDAITIVTSTAGHEARKKTHSDRLERIRSVDSRNKLKTRLCTKWERTGTCSYGSLCTFAHGNAELRSVGSSNPQQLETSAAGISAPANFQTPNAIAIGSSAPPKKKRFDWDDFQAPNAIGSSAPPKKKRFDWDDVHKISQIYADWIEPPPPPP